MKTLPFSPFLLVGVVPAAALGGWETLNELNQAGMLSPALLGAVVCAGVAALGGFRPFRPHDAR